MIRRALLVRGCLGESVSGVVRVERLSRLGLRVGSGLELVSLGTRGGDGGREDGEDGDNVGEVHGDG